jgi:hypothetical protein
MSNEVANREVWFPTPDGATIREGSRNGEWMFGKEGKHFLIEFSNGWKLSILDAWGSYGVEAGLFDPTGNMPMDNPVFDGDSVEGYLTPERLTEIIERVNAL